MTTQSAPIIPDALDALIADPTHHTLLMENDRVRVLETRIPPGDRTEIHTHCWPGVLYILSWSQIVRRDHTGQVIFDSRTVEAMRTPPPSMWSLALPPHTLENVGTTDLHLINVELKEPAP